VPAENFDDLLIHPDRMIVRYVIDGVAGKPALKSMDELEEVMRRANAKFGDPSKVIGNPQMPEIESPKKRRRA
jgi:hypothetical protein